jgi:hypothetical protein
VGFTDPFLRTLHEEDSPQLEMTGIGGCGPEHGKVGRHLVCEERWKRMDRDVN